MIRVYIPCSSFCVTLSTYFLRKCPIVELWFSCFLTSQSPCCSQSHTSRNIHCWSNCYRIYNQLQRKFRFNVIRRFLDSYVEEVFVDLRFCNNENVQGFAKFNCFDMRQTSYSEIDNVNMGKKWASFLCHLIEIVPYGMQDIYSCKRWQFFSFHDWPHDLVVCKF